MIPPPNSLIDVSGATSFELSQQPPCFVLRQSASHHLFPHSLLCRAIKLMAFARDLFGPACVWYSSLIKPALRSASLRPTGMLCRQSTRGAGLFRSCEPRATFARFEPAA